MIDSCAKRSPRPSGKEKKEKRKEEKRTEQVEV